MKRYNMADLSSGIMSGHDEGLSLSDALGMTDWSEQEVDQIADLKVGEKYESEGIVIIRTK